MRSPRPILFALIALVSSAAICEAADEVGVGLLLKLEDVSIPQDGVVVGELVLRNVSLTPAFQPAASLDVYYGDLVFVVRTPSGEDVACRSRIMAEGSSPEILKLQPGQYVRKPVCLLSYGGRYLFSDIGKYAIRAEFGSCPTLSSPWTYVDVVRGGDGRDRYLASHKEFGNVYGAFIRSNWAAEMLDKVDTFGSYSRENAKLALFQYGQRALIGMLRPQLAGAQAGIEAAKGLSLARRYKIGVQMWEYIDDRVRHPEKLKRTDVGLVQPIDEYYF